MIKYMSALTALALTPTAADATTVNIDYSSDLIFPAGLNITGSLSFDPGDGVLTSTRNFGAVVASTYESPTFTTNYRIGASASSGFFALQIVDYGAGGTEYYFFTPVPNQSYNLNFKLVFTADQAMNVPALHGYEDAVFADVSVIEPTFNQVLALGVATYAVSYVPEPGTWAMMIVGFGLTACAMRRRRSVTAKVSFA